MRVIRSVLGDVFSFLLFELQETWLLWAFFAVVFAGFGVAYLLGWQPAPREQRPVTPPDTCYCAPPLPPGAGIDPIMPPIVPRFPN